MLVDPRSSPFCQCFFLRKRPKNAVPGERSRALANARLNVRQEKRESAPVVLIALASRAIRGADVGLQTAPARDACLALLLGRVASSGCWRGDAVMRQVRSHRVVDGVNGSATHVCSAAGRQFDLVPVGNRPRRRDRRRATLGGAGAPDEYPSACRPFWRRPSTATSGTLAARRCSLAATWRCSGASRNTNRTENKTT
jgi:hypothetical protein